MLLTISVVSHGHSDSVRHLLNELISVCRANHVRIILTLNAPELDKINDQELIASTDLPLTIIKNDHKKGFAENHNAAFKLAEPGVWSVVNPDIRLPSTPLNALISALSDNNVGFTFPKQMSPAGEALDYRRALVTPWSLLKRYLLRLPERPARPDWVSGCFMAFRSEVYQQLGGFDERYFLYCEDVDICLRLQLAGYKMVEADFSIVHDTRRGTLKKFDHFKWHVASLLKLWCSRAFWAYLWNRHKIRQR